MNRMTVLLAGTMLATGSGVASAQTATPQVPVAQPARAASLELGFREPPQAARPYVWWHWLDGNVSKEGIKLDLEWMKRAGIGGVQIFDGSLAHTVIVPKRVPYLSPEWQDTFRYAVDLAREKGMEIGIPTSSGWSETGAPFVKPEDGMKKFVWSETVLPGGRGFAGVLPLPASAAGPFRDAPMGAELTGGGKVDADRNLYRDTRVLAYRVPADDVALPRPKVTTVGGTADVALDDGTMREKLQLPLPTKAAPAWVRLDYPKPVTIRSATLALAPKFSIWVNPSYPVTIEASDDGVHFKPAATFEMGNFVQRSVTFPAVTGRAFRVVVGQPVSAPPPWANPVPGAITFDLFANNAKTLPISQLALHPVARVERAEEKAGFAALDDYYAAATPAVDAGSIAAPGDVVDITARMKPDGALDWTPPAGRWRVIRFGWSLTGKENGPANPEGTGLEVDKLSAPRVAAYMNTYLGQFEQTLGTTTLPSKGLSATMSDSIEAGYSNWTDDILDQFKTRRGYDPTPYLPALTGRLIGSAAATEAFLFDFRRTIGDLVSDAHYAEVAKAAHAHGMTSYGESIESARVSLGDDMAMRSHTDIPTGAMWQFGDEGPTLSAIADLRGASSIAHLRGLPLVAAESMTTAFHPWASAPADLKQVADAEFANGVNRFLIHSSVHQPLIDKQPGLTLLIFGQYFNRNETWAEQARAWTDYLARTSYMLQQGRYLADVAFFYGEEAPLVALYGKAANTAAPTNYGYDYVNADSLLNLLSVRDGVLVTPTGMRYRVLQLGGSASRMSLPVLRKIRDLVTAGATVVGEKPVGSPGLADDPAEFTSIADALWGGRTGKGRVLAGQPVDAALAAIGVTPDHAVVGAAGTSFAFVHRRLDEGDLWFVSNPGAAATGEVAFRTSGRAPELWDAETGNVTPLDYRSEGDRTIVRLDLAQHGSALILFGKPMTAPQRVTKTAVEERETSLADGWTMSFQAGRGAPAAPMHTALGSWTDSKDAGIRYFSGTATYTRTIVMPRNTRGKRVMLDLGSVHDVADVAVNGKVLRTLWKAPYRVDITDALKPGRNALSVKVTNVWANRLIGDLQPGAAKVTTTFFPTYKPDASLRPSGLIGPVKLIEMSGG